MNKQCIMGAVFAAVLAHAVPAQAGGGPDGNGCYRNTWFEPWLTGWSCTNPALGDPEATAPQPARVGVVPRDYEPECPKDKPQ